MTHTPGPWVAKGDGCVRHEITIREGVNWMQAIKLGSGWREDAWTGDDADAETLANARLIAAAPELLEALENLLEVQANLECGEVDLRLAVKDARAAISKARGETA